jgi:hypothetical protein
MTLTAREISLTNSSSATVASTASLTLNNSGTASLTCSATHSETKNFGEHSLGSAWELAVAWLRSSANGCMILGIGVGSSLLAIFVISCVTAALLSSARCQILTDTNVNVPLWRALFVLHPYVGAVWPCHFRCAPLHALQLLLHFNLLFSVLAWFCHKMPLTTPVEAAVAVGVAIIASSAPQPLISAMLFYYEFDQRDEKHRTLHVVVVEDQPPPRGPESPVDAAQPSGPADAIDSSIVFGFDDDLREKEIVDITEAIDVAVASAFPTSSESSTPSTELEGENTQRSEWMPVTTHHMWTGLLLLVATVMLVAASMSLTTMLDAAGKCSPELATTSFRTLFWMALLLDLLVGQSMYIGGVYFFRRMTSDDSGRPWAELHPFNGEWRQCCDTAAPSGREVALKRLKASLRDAGAYCMLGKSMAHQEVVILHNGVGVSRRQCFEHALRIDPTSARAWKGMGHCLWPGEAIDVDGEAWGRSSCYAQALELRPLDAELWFLLGNALAVTEAVLIRGKTCSPQDCYKESLRQDPLRSMAWNNLGATLDSGTGMADIGGRCWTKRMCYVEALRLSASNVLAWSNLATSLGRAEHAQLSGGQTVSKRDCCLGALEHDSSSSAAWNKLGATLGPSEVIALHGRRWSRIECYIQALSISPRLAAAWTNLGACLSPAAAAHVNGCVYNRQQCFLEALRHCPCYSSAWDQLGWTINPGDPPVSVGGEQLGRAACFIRVVETADAFKELVCDEGRGK